MPGKIEVETKVVWLVEREIQPQIYPGMGVEFYNISPELEGQIVEFVNRNLTLGCLSEDG
jgi:Tfp pilus assembly protein PilZ